MRKIKYCLFLSFFSIGSFCMDGSEKEKLAIEKKCCDGTNKQYTEALANFSADGAAPFIVHLISDAPVYMWDALIFMSYRDKKITASDLRWVIQEFSKPQAVSLKDAEELFRLTISMHAKKSAAPNKEKIPDDASGDSCEKDVYYADEVEKLISEISLPEALDFWSAGALYINPAARNRIDSVLIICIENRYYRAFEEILKAFPEFVATAYEKKLLKREERGALISEGWARNVYAYNNQEYSLIEWLTRHESVYLTKGTDYRENYVKAMQIIIQELLKQGSNDKKNITENVFGIMQQLFQQEDLDQETLRQGARQLIIAESEKSE